MTVCSNEGCDASAYRRCLCLRHYRKALQKGSIQRTFIRGNPQVNFLSKVEKTENGCWVWKGSYWAGGYGMLSVGNKTTLAHRHSYNLFVGEIPTGLQLDHLCRNRGCVNPTHLEPVTALENLSRGDTFVARNISKTHCPKDHPYSGDNLYLTPDGRRDCRKCRSAATAKSVAKRKAEKS